MVGLCYYQVKAIIQTTAGDRLFVANQLIRDTTNAELDEFFVLCEKLDVECQHDCKIWKPYNGNEEDAVCEDAKLRQRLFEKQQTSNQGTQDI